MTMWMIAAAVILACLYLWMICPKLPRRDISFLQGVDYAHRGLWNDERPENSLAAFRAAVDKGYGIELDVHRTADGHLVVHHDDNLKRLCGVDRVIANSTLAQVREARLPNGEAVPTFDEVLEAVGGRSPLIVEVKVEKNADALSQAVYERMQRYDGPWCMESFDPWAVAWFRQHAPQVIRGQLAFCGVRKGRTWKLKLRNLGIASLIQCQWSRPDFVAFEARSEKRFNLPMRLMRLMRPWLVAWTIRSQAEMDELRTRYDLIIFERFEARKS